jgi:hypothetical protein
VLWEGMKTDILSAAAVLSDADLLARLERLAELGREGCAELVGHLAEMERRKTYLGEGWGTLFGYCTGALRLSEYAAYTRIEGARAARRFPVVLDLLVAGSVNLTTVRVLGPYLTVENHEAVLAEAAGRSKRETEAIVARLAPLPDVPAFLRKLPVSASWRQAATVSAASGAVPPAVLTGPPAARPIVAPLAPERFRVQFTVGKETHEKLRFAQDMLRREIPDGDPGAIFDRALTLLLDEVARTKMAATAAPGPDRVTAPGSRHIPAAVKRAVWFRDRGQCAFVSKLGRRCKQRSFLELHHIQPFAVGGEATAGNIALRCRGHNAYEAAIDFGPYVPPAAQGNGDSGPLSRAIRRPDDLQLADAGAAGRVG